MKFKTGSDRKAGFDEENGRYFGECGGTMAYDLYELTAEMYDRLDEKMK